MTSSKASSIWNPAVDVYINKSAAFAQPILRTIREVIHEAVPEITEEIKWSMPFFVYNGIILGNIAAFKAHCSFGVWKQNVKPLMKDGVEQRGGGMGSFGKLTSTEDLPAIKDLKKLLVESAAKIDSGERFKNWERPTANKTLKAKAEIPPALAAALKKSRVAAQNFEKMSPSCQREYIEWVAEAKRDETREKRVATSLEWIVEGKSRNWKYEKRA